MAQDDSKIVEFSGTPEAYRKVAVIGSVLLNLYLYLGMVVLLYVVNDQDWILGWKPMLVAVLFATWFARAAYRWIMRLDAQYGSGRAGNWKA